MKDFLKLPKGSIVRSEAIACVVLYDGEPALNIRPSIEIVFWVGMGLKPITICFDSSKYRDEAAAEIAQALCQ